MSDKDTCSKCFEGYTLISNSCIQIIIDNCVAMKDTSLPKLK